MEKQVSPAAQWAEFSRQVEHRLQKGLEEYGDRSFSARPTELVREISEELLDVSAWSFILWARLQYVFREGLGLSVPAPGAEPADLAELFAEMVRRVHSTGNPEPHSTGEPGPHSTGE